MVHINVHVQHALVILQQLQYGQHYVIDVAEAGRLQLHAPRSSQYPNLLNVIMQHTRRAFLSAGISRAGVQNVRSTNDVVSGGGAYLATLPVVQATCPVDDGVIGAVIQNDGASYGAPSVFGAEVVEALEYWAILADITSR